MPDLGHAVDFGAFLSPSAADPVGALAQAVRADALGLDLLGVQDHPYAPALLDCWTYLSAVASATRSIRLVPDVLNLPLRQPAVLARAATSLDLLSGGRVELGLGAGAFPDPIASLGGPRRSPGESVAALAEAVEVVRALWRPGPPVTLDGVHHRLEGARPGPPPPHPIGIWLGAYGPRMLALTGRTADAWLPTVGYIELDAVTAANQRIDDAAADAGRDPAQVRRVLNVTGRFTRTATGFLAGPPAVWAEQLVELVLGEGFSGFLLGPGEDVEGDLGRFAAEVAPAVREAVAAARAVVPPSPSPTVPETARVVLPAQGSPAARDADATDTPVAAWAVRAQGEDGVLAEGLAARSTLLAVHEHLRSELAQIEDAIEQVATGHRDPGLARSMINALAVRQNDWTLGAFCASYCRVVTGHHTIEDVDWFPRLREAHPHLGPVIDRLEGQHHAIAGLLTGLDDALVAMVAAPPGPQVLAGVHEAVEALGEALLAHLAEEEEALLPAVVRTPGLA